MKVYLGEKGLGRTWQKDFSTRMKCHKCKGECRIMFVAKEEVVKNYVSNLRDNGGEGDYWVHDAIACAVYLCKECFEPNAILNQA